MADSSANYFLVAAGGTGMRCLQSFINLCAIGMFNERIGKVHILLMDTDEENKDKRNAENLIKEYKKICEAIGTREHPFFGCELELSVFVPDYSKDSMRNFIILSQLERGNSDINRKLANIFFEENVQEFDLSHGYRAQTHLGSYLMYHAFIEEVRKSVQNRVYGNNSQLFRFINAVSAANNTEARVFAFGSSFGGTGASSIPVIPKAISDCVKIMTGGKFNTDKIYYGGVVLSSYFKFKAPSDEEKKKEKVIADSQFFTHNSASALNYYVNDFTISKTYKRLYLLGWPTMLNVDIDAYKTEFLGKAKDDKTITGGKDQENPAHILEVFSAAAAHHFFHPDNTQTKTLEGINSTQFMYKSMVITGDGKSENANFIIEPDDILFKKPAKDSTEIPVHQRVLKNLISFYAIGKLVHHEFRGNLAALVEDLRIYNSKYDVRPDDIEAFSYFLNYFSLIPKGDESGGYNPGWLTQVFGTFRPDGEQDFLGIRRDFFTPDPSRWSLAFPELSGGNRKDKFMKRFKKINKNNGGNFRDLIEALRSTFYSFQVDSKKTVQSEE